MTTFKIVELKPDLVSTSTRQSVIYSHANEKGGVGKTTISFFQAFRLAENGKRVLVLDYDGQRNMTKTLSGGDSSHLEQIERKCFTTADLFNPKTKLEQVRVCQSPLHENIHFIPSHKAKIADVLNAGSENAQVLMMNPINLVQSLDYDFILIDTPPSLGLTQLSAIATVDRVFIPVAIDDYSNEGLQSMIATITSVKRALKSNVEVGGIYINYFEKPSTRIKGDNPELKILKDIEKFYSKVLITDYIPRSINIKEARMKGIPVWRKPPNGNAAVVGRKVKTAIDSLNKRLKK
ncbi:ParA family protein [Vibrio ostreicida]|uniref:ParA family protein n=1 Tax=Vibrio ostreicida TaxID=526588 RepID=UPI003B5C907A